MPLPRIQPSSLTRSSRILRAGAFLLPAFPLVVIAYRGLPAWHLPLPPIARAAVVALLLAGFNQALLRREQRSLAEFRVSLSPRSWSGLLVGFAGGFALFGLGALALRALLPFHWALNPAAALPVIATAAGYYVITATCEELAWHGFAFDSLIRALGFWPAQLIVALVAAGFHVVCGWTWAAALISTTAGALLFGRVFYRWRSLPAAIGVHAAWNWTRDLLFGPATPGALFTARGTETWTSAQWHIAQGILVAVTWTAILVLSLTDSRPSDRDG